MKVELGGSITLLTKVFAHGKMALWGMHIEEGSISGCGVDAWHLLMGLLLLLQVLYLLLARRLWGQI